MSYQFRDPIHGLIDVSDKEEKLIAHPAFQRLRYIRQLGTTYLVYHGAEHTRFGHSLGVMHLVGKAMDSLWQRKCINNNYIKQPEYERLKQIGRIVALLHDVGHGPFSHVGEESGLYPELEDIDGEKRSGHEIYTKLLIRDVFGPLIDELFSSEGITKEDILKFFSGFIKDKKHLFVKDLISGQLDADRMDYLLRDSHYCGVQYGKYDLPRMLDTLSICHPQNDPEREWQLGVESSGIHAVEEFIYARYWMFIQVYFHKTRRIYDHYLVNFIKDILKSEGLNAYPSDLDLYLPWIDSKIIQLIEKQGKKNAKWAENLYRRKHIKEAFVSKPHPEEDEDEKKDELGKIAWVIEQVDNLYSEEDYHIDQSKTSSSKYLIEIPIHIEETQEDEDNKLFAIPVKDKFTNIIKAIQDYSLPVASISGKKINILRIYAKEEIKEEMLKYCNNMYEAGYTVYVREVEKKKEEVERKRREYEEAQKQYEIEKIDHKKRKDKIK